jgi:xanthine dehydrogenase accessory factor
VTDIFNDLVKLNTDGGEAVLVTVVEKEGHGPAVVGTKMLVFPNGDKKGTVGGGALEYAAVTRGAHMLNDKECGLYRYLLGPDNEIVDDKSEKTGMICGGSITLFFEYIGSGARLYIFGAGHIGKALTYHLKNLNYYITLLDNRDGLAESIDGAQRRFTSDYRYALQDEKVPTGAFFIIATHSHALDYVVLKRIYEAGWNPKYIGMVASKRKAPMMIEQLKNELGKEIDLDCLFSPVGLDIGGAGPDEIAISIISELQAARYGKSGHNHMKK